MKRVDLADIGGADMGTLIQQQAADQAGARSEVHVYVLEVTFFGEYGWTSVHRTPEGAQARLEAKVDEYDARDAYTAALAGEISGETCRAAGEEGDPIVWGISLLPVEE